MHLKVSKFSTNAKTRVRKMSSDSYLSLHDAASLGVADPAQMPGLASAEGTSSREVEVKPLSHKIEDNGPWLKLHTEQQTVMMDEWAVERRKLKEENERLRNRLAQASESIVVLENLCKQNNIPIPRSRFPFARRKNTCQDSKMVQNVLESNRSASPLTVCSGASTVLVGTASNLKTSGRPACNEVFRDKLSNGTEKNRRKKRQFILRRNFSACSIGIKTIKENSMKSDESTPPCTPPRTSKEIRHESKGLSVKYLGDEEIYKYIGYYEEEKSRRPPPVLGIEPRTTQEPFGTKKRRTNGRVLHTEEQNIFSPIVVPSSELNTMKTNTRQQKSKRKNRTTKDSRRRQDLSAPTNLMVRSLSLIANDTSSLSSCAAACSDSSSHSSEISENSPEILSILRYLDRAEI